MALTRQSWLFRRKEAIVCALGLTTMCLLRHRIESSDQASFRLSRCTIDLMGMVFPLVGSLYSRLGTRVWMRHLTQSGHWGAGGSIRSRA